MVDLTDSMMANTLAYRISQERRSCSVSSEASSSWTRCTLRLLPYVPRDCNVDLCPWLTATLVPDEETTELHVAISMDVYAKGHKGYAQVRSLPLPSLLPC